MKDKVWFITGCSTGFGRELAKEVLEAGYKAVVTARNPNDVKDIVNEYPENALAIKLDVTKPEQVTAAVAAAQQHFGKICLKF